MRCDAHDAAAGPAACWPGPSIALPWRHTLKQNILKVSVEYSGRVRSAVEYGRSCSSAWSSSCNDGWARSGVKSDSRCNAPAFRLFHSRKRCDLPRDHAACNALLVTRPSSRPLLPAQISPSPAESSCGAAGRCCQHLARKTCSQGLLVPPSEQQNSPLRRLASLV